MKASTINLSPRIHSGGCNEKENRSRHCGREDTKELDQKNNTANGLSLLRLTASTFYRIAYKLHHRIFLRPHPPLRTRVIIVGSYLAGGAGKTPFTIWLAKQFIEQGKSVAVLCHSAAWDEFILLQKELESNPVQIQQLQQNGSTSTQPEVKVFATKNRYKTAKEIQDKFDIILCDDGFEDTRFTGTKRICLDWEEPPQALSKLWPAGPYRSLKQDHDEREILHLDCYGKKCSDDAPTAHPDIQFFIESLTNYKHGQTLAATVVCGLGSPQRFINDIRAFGVAIEKYIIRPDHDKHFSQAVQAELAQHKDVIVSQKDACRLPQPLLAHPKLHIAIQKISVSDNAIKKLQLLL